MSANTSSNHVVYQSSPMSYRGATASRPVGTSRPSGLETVCARAVRFLLSIPQRQAVRSELSRLSDRELADIGLTRNEIAQVFSRAR